MPGVAQRGAALMAAGLLAAPLLAGCGGAPAERTDPVAASAAPRTDEPSATVGPLSVSVTGFHVYPLPDDDPGAARAAAQLGVPAGQIRQLHLLLAWRNSGPEPVPVEGDRLRLALGELVLDPATAEAVPTGPLRPGETVETAVGFDVATRGPGGPVRLRWTHDGAETELPVGAARRLG